MIAAIVSMEKAKIARKQPGKMIVVSFRTSFSGNKVPFGLVLTIGVMILRDQDQGMKYQYEFDTVNIDTHIPITLKIIMDSGLNNLPIIIDNGIINSVVIHKTKDANKMLSI
ncbi:hypothetical protein NXS11_08445 [Staphylococcus sp. GRT3]|uniref:Uncharacterized protein n=1 Tax=Staphylococcus americanisciuri TaxID=2973940 RepID=A0ABT2F389_9STAP|nr:hypothetical protein [Staphylococcus americanisciuri]MCS4486924.1 hypothetical protein [Staphylococcus americanisciuri]